VSIRLVNLVADAADLAASAHWWGRGPRPWTVLADPEGNELCVLSAS
jgi:hypothetical protein